ncbi:MAG: DegT/DnrJ/EryC1/StrS aminotransferase family protein [Candidatus Omnitrophota bacterium]
MIAKVPILRTPAGYRDILWSCVESLYPSVGERFRAIFLRQFTFARVTGSGIAAFYLLLKAAAQRSGRKEVILPAYTAGSLVVAVKKAGLIPVLCDVSLKDFNLNETDLYNTLSGQTLAVVAVHMFGIGVSYIAALKAKIGPDVVLIEDCAQAMGTMIGSCEVGAFGDASFFSFNRGKNIPTSAGGLVVTNSEKLVSHIEKLWAQEAPRNVMFSNVNACVRSFALSCIRHPFVYGLLYPFASVFKEKKYASDFSITRIAPFNAALGFRLYQRVKEFARARYENGVRMLNALEGTPGLILPVIPQGVSPAFNRLPIVFKEIAARQRAEDELYRMGIETSRMYGQPLHCMFELGYKKESLPNAVFLAERLLTLPVYPGLSDTHMSVIIDTIRRAGKDLR